MNLNTNLFGRACQIAAAVFLAASIAAASLPVFAQQFPDVPARHTNSKAINYLVDKGFIAGYPDGSFRPEQAVNRAEALKIFLQVAGIPTESAGANFGDVSDSDWFAPFVGAAVSRGIVAGYSDGSFKPGQTVNRAEALKMLLVAGGAKLDRAASYEQFADTPATEWFAAFTGYAHLFGLVDADSTGNAKPGELMTRGQIAELAYRFATRLDRVCQPYFDAAEEYRTNYFSSIELDRPLPSLVFEDEVRRIAGSAAGSEVTAFYRPVGDAATQTVITQPVENGGFAVAVPFTRLGTQQFSMIPGSSGRAAAAMLTVAPGECAPRETGPAPTAPADLAVSLENNQPTFSWAAAPDSLIRFSMQQGDLQYERLLSGSQTTFRPEVADFEGWQIGEASWSVAAAQASAAASSAPRSAWSEPAASPIRIGQFHFSEIRADAVTVDDLPVFRAGSAIEFSGQAEQALNGTGFVIRPDGSVGKIAIKAGVIQPGESFEFRAPLTEPGTYIVEINDTAGLAAINHPVYAGGMIPLIPDPLSLAQRDALYQPKLSVNRERAIWLRSVNEARTAARQPELALNEDLSAAAQAYAERMASEGFIGHDDPQGKNANDRRLAAGYPVPVGENLARDTRVEFAHEGLMRSAAHRLTLLQPEWTRVGLGIAQDSQGLQYFVQYFSADPLTESNLAATKQEFLNQLNAARAAENLPSLSLNPTLSVPAQSWSGIMAGQALAATSFGDQSLEKTVRAAGYRGAFSAFVIGASFVYSAAESITGSASGVLSSETSSIGLGLAQAADGSLRFTIIY